MRPTDEDRIAALEREVAELRRELRAARGTEPTRPEWLPHAGRQNSAPAMCATCQAKADRGETAVCGCVLFGPKITCQVTRQAILGVVAESVTLSTGAYRAPGWRVRT